MAKATRTSKKVVTAVTQEQFNEAISAYALADASACKMVAKMDAEITKIRQKYLESLDGYRLACEGSFEIMEVYARENKDVLFNEKRHIDTPHGKVGFRLGTPKLKTLPKWTWERVLDKLQTVLPDYVRAKMEVDKERLIGDRADEVVARSLNEVGVYVDQDEAFYVELKKEEVL